MAGPLLASPAPSLIHIYVCELHPSHGTTPPPCLPKTLPTLPTNIAAAAAAANSSQLGWQAASLKALPLKKFLLISSCLRGQFYPSCSEPDTLEFSAAVEEEEES